MSISPPDDARDYVRCFQVAALHVASHVYPLSENWVDIYGPDARKFAVPSKPMKLILGLRS
jgi:hypothetical protein